MFDDRPFESGGDIRQNNHKGKMAEEMARSIIRSEYGEPVKINDKRGGADFKARNEFTGQKYEIEVKSGGAQLTQAQEIRREKIADDIIYVVLRIPEPPR